MMNHPYICETTNNWTLIHYLGFFCYTTIFDLLKCTPIFISLFGLDEPLQNFVPWHMLVHVPGTGGGNKTVILNFFTCKIGAKYIKRYKDRWVKVLLGRVNEIMPIVA